MKSEYVQKENGLYILSKNDIENIADGVIREYEIGRASCRERV